MSKTWIKWIRLICIAILCGIGAVQLVYALLWAIVNGNNIQDFYDTALYLSNMETLTSDGWRLIGYSYYLKVFYLSAPVLGLNWIVLVYVSQVLVSMCCFTVAIRSIPSKLLGVEISYPHALLIAGYMITLPIVWQMQFAVLPDALCLSLTVLLFAKITEIISDRSVFRWDALLVVGGVLLLLGVLQHHYFYGAVCLCIAEIVIMLFGQVIKRFRSRNIWIAAFILVMFVIGIPYVTKTINETVPKEELYATYSLEADLWARFVYPNLKENYPAYTERITAIITEYGAQVCDGRYEHYLNSIGPMIEINNPDEASEIYLEMVEIGWELHKPYLTECMLKEAASYLFMPPAMVKYMYRSGASLYGHNYIKMYEKSPILTADYMHAGMNGFLAACILGVIMYFIDLFIEKKQRIKYILFGLYGCMAIICITAPMMLFSFAKFDYRIGLFSVFVWGLIVVGNITKKRSSGENNG